LRQRRNAEKTAEERFNMLARGWLAYLGLQLYNRPSAVDALIHNQPQVGKPTWGYDYTTALRRLPHPSSTIPIGKTRHHHLIAPTARCEKPPKSGFIR